MKNWKTSATGAAAVLAAVSDLLNVLAGTGDSSHLGVDLASLMAGVGLLFAKDHNVTGGDTRQ